MKRRTVSFDAVAAAQSMTIEVARGIEAGEHSLATLMVRVHSASIGGSSDGQIRVNVRVDADSPDDPAAFFTGRKLTQVIAATASSVAPAYTTAAFWPRSDRLLVEVEGVQDSTTAGSLQADLSIALSLRASDAILPAQLPGLLLHLDAMRGVTTTGADLVTRWADQSGAGNDFTSASGQRPTYLGADPDFNGYPSLRFGGAASFTKLNTTTFPTTGSARTGVIVAIADADPPALVDDAGLWRFGNGVKPAVPDTDGVIKDSFAATARIVTADPGVSLTSPFIYMVTATTNDWANYLGGGPALHQESSVTFTANSTVNIGAGNTSSSSWLGQIAEVAIFDRKLEPRELDGLGRYLSSKFQIPWTSI